MAEEQRRVNLRFSAEWMLNLKQRLLEWGELGWDDVGCALFEVWYESWGSRDFCQKVAEKIRQRAPRAVIPPVDTGYKIDNIDSLPSNITGEELEWLLKLLYVLRSGHDGANRAVKPNLELFYDVAKKEGTTSGTDIPSEPGPESQSGDDPDDDRGSNTGGNTLAVGGFESTARANRELRIHFRTSKNTARKTGSR